MNEKLIIDLLNCLDWLELCQALESCPWLLALGGVVCEPVAGIPGLWFDHFLQVLDMLVLG